MLPLDTCQAHSPAKDLHTSQGRAVIAHKSRKAEMKKSRNMRRLGRWNVRSILDTDGLIEVASQGNEWGEDMRSLDLVFRKLAQYNVVAGASQETKWFGCGTSEVGNSMVMTSGWSALRKGQTVQRGDGVSLVFRQKSSAALRLGGQQWKA